MKPRILAAAALLALAVSPARLDLLPAGAQAPERAPVVTGVMPDPDSGTLTVVGFDFGPNRPSPRLA